MIEVDENEDIRCHEVITPPGFFDEIGERCFGELLDIIATDFIDGKINHHDEH